MDAGHNSCGRGHVVARRPTSAAAARMAEAEREREYGANLKAADGWLADLYRREATRMAQEVRRELTPAECAALGVPTETWLVDGRLVTRMRDTMQAPDALTAAAQVERTRLAQDAGCLDLAYDTARSVQPTNSLGRMLAHQLAAAHASAMRLVASADGWLREAEAPAGYTLPTRAQLASVKAARHTCAAARMMTAFQDGVAALEAAERRAADRDRPARPCLGWRTGRGRRQCGAG